MKQRIFSFLLTMCLLASMIVLFPVTASAAVEYKAGDYTYTISNGEATIVSVSPEISGDVRIPERLGGYPVTHIGQSAFSLLELTGITIPDTVVSIAQYAFAYAPISSIIIPDSVIDIEAGAFYMCHGLDNIIVDDNNPVYSSVDGVLFNKNQTTLIICPAGYTHSSYTIPYGVTTIADCAFEFCWSLDSIIIPDSVVTIGSCAFVETNLISVDIPDSVTGIGWSAFADCRSLQSVRLSNRITNIASSTFENCTSLHTIGIPDSVVRIDGGAFADCRNLRSIKIPNSVTSIGGSTFVNCIRLKSIRIPNSVTRIESGLFWGCSSLTDITLPNSITIIKDYAFYECYEIIDVYYNGTADEWNAVSIDSEGNEGFLGANIHYISNDAIENVTDASASGGTLTFVAKVKAEHLNLPYGIIVNGKKFYGARPGDTVGDYYGSTQFDYDGWNGEFEIVLTNAKQGIKNYCYFVGDKITKEAKVTVVSE